jgi:DNA-binding response OmpR family regulator
MGKSIYIAEDDADIRALIELFLNNEGYAVRAFSTGDALLDAFNAQPADMVILDIMLPGTDGLTLCARLRRRSNVPIIIVSARDSEADRIAGITLGSDDYLTKPFSPMELTARVKALFRRLDLDRGAPEPDSLQLNNLTLDPAARTAAVDGAPLDLTPTEFLLLAYLLRQGERAVSREELLKNVWKYDFEVDTRATDDVMKRLRKKLLQAGAQMRIETVWGFGFRIVAEGT